MRGRFSENGKELRKRGALNERNILENINYGKYYKHTPWSSHSKIKLF